MTLPVVEISKIKKPLETKQSIIIAIISLILGSAIFTVAYVSMNQHALLDTFNQPVLSWIISHRYQYATDIAKIATTLADPVILSGIILGISIIWAIANREIWRPFILTFSVGVAAIVSKLLKNVIMNDRPSQINMIQPFETGFSFPSGHTIGTVVFLLVLGYLLYSRHFSGGKLIGWIILAFFGTAVIAISRLYLGYHWLTDVVASVGLGLIILAVIIIIDKIVTNCFRKLE